MMKVYHKESKYKIIPGGIEILKVNKMLLETYIKVCCNRVKLLIILVIIKWLN